MKQDMIEDSEVSAGFEILLEIDIFACQISLKDCIGKNCLQYCHMESHENYSFMKTHIN